MNQYYSRTALLNSIKTDHNIGSLLATFFDIIEQQSMKKRLGKDHFVNNALIFSIFINGRLVFHDN